MQFRAVPLGAVLLLLTISEVSAISMVSRSAWNARSPRSVGNLQVTPQLVFIHHTATPACWSLTACASRMRSIQNYHMNTKGWWDIGYNFLIGQDGRVYEGRGWGKTGAHTVGYNSMSIGIALIGNFGSSSPNTNSISALQSLLGDGVNQGMLSSLYTVYGHRQVASTVCPGQNLYNIISSWLRFRNNPPQASG